MSNNGEFEDWSCGLKLRRERKYCFQVNWASVRVGVADAVVLWGKDGGDILALRLVSRGLTVVVISREELVSCWDFGLK